MSTRLHIQGSWPGSLIVRRGWARVSARPWNDDVTDIAVRLHRGRDDFLSQATRAVREIHEAPACSPALYPSVTNVWKRAGYEVFADLEVMERSLVTSIEATRVEVAELPRARAGELLAVDRAAFEDFWRMNTAGIVEALEATTRSSILVTREGERVTGYAVVGCQVGVSFLQRMAVVPAEAGKGFGTALVRASLQWAKRQGARTMVLNVRHENVRARQLYKRSGFIETGSRVELLAYNG